MISLGGPAAPAISILLPLFNGERFLAEQLDSILAQSWSDFELIVVDDGSTDSSAAVIVERASGDPRIRVLSSQGNRGQKARLAQLLGEARGAMIAISDQDDVWDAHKLERLAGGIGSAGLAFGRSELIDGQGRAIGRSLLDAIGAPPGAGQHLALLFRPQVSGHAMLVRRDFVTPAMFESSQPFDWLISLAAHFSLGTVYVPDAVVLHRMHEANSYNSNILVRSNPLRLRRGHFATLARWTARRRARLVEGLELVANWPDVPEPAPRIFAEVGRLCSAAWSPAGGMSASRLRNTVLAKLKPLAGSESDWRITVDHMTVLAFGLAHPYALTRLRRVL